MSIGVVNTIYPLIIGLIYGKTDLGNYVYLYSWIFIFALASDVGLGPATLRFVAYDENLDDGKRTLKTIYGLWLIYIIISALLLFYLFTYLVAISLVEIIIIVFILIFHTSHRLLRRIFQGIEEFNLLKKIELTSLSVFLISVTLILILSKFITSHLFIFYFLPPLIFHVTFFIYSYFKGVIVTPSIDITLAKSLLRFGVFSGFGSLFGLGLNYFQFIFMSLYFTKEQLGTIAFWSYLVYPMLLVGQAINTVLIPRIVVLSKKDSSLAYKLVYLLIKELVIISFSISLYFLIFFNILRTGLKFLADNEYFSNYGLVLGMLYLLQGSSNLLITTLSSDISAFEERVKYNPFISLVSFIVTIIFWFVFHSFLGLIVVPFGLILSTQITLFLLCILITHFEHKKTHWKMFFLDNLYLLLSLILLFSCDHINTNFLIFMCYIFGILLLFPLFKSIKRIYVVFK